MQEIRKLPQRQGPADHRGDGQGDEGRPREVHRGRRLGLPVQAGGHACSCWRCCAAGCTGEHATVSDRSRRRPMRTMDERSTSWSSTTCRRSCWSSDASWRSSARTWSWPRSGAEALRELLRARVRRDPARRQHAGHRRLRDRGADPPVQARSAHTPIIFVTAYADEMQTAQGYSLGAVDYILSPVVPEVLRTKVKVFVELYRAQQRTAQARARAAGGRARRRPRRRRGARTSSPTRAASSAPRSTWTQGMRRLLELLVPRAGRRRAALGAARGRGSSRCRAAVARGPRRWTCLGGLPASLQRALREGRKAELVRRAARRRFPARCATCAWSRCARASAPSACSCSATRAG